MSDAPIVPADVLTGIDEAELLRRAHELPLRFDPGDPQVRPLMWSLVFAQWPDLLPDGTGVDDLARFYNRYFWFARFVSGWQAEHGNDAGLEQQSFQLIEEAPDGVDWGIVEQLDQQARGTA